MDSPLTAGDIMTRRVVTATADAPLQGVIRTMLDQRISGVPVLDGSGRMVGILTEGDLLRRVELGTGPHRAKWLEFLRGPTRIAQDYVETHSRVVGDIMTRDVVSVDEAAPLSEVVSVMQGKRVRRVPVLAGATLVGMVSRADLLRALSHAFEASTDATAPSDAVIRAQVLAEFDRQSWAPGGGISVAVTGGTVDIDGMIYCEEDRIAMRVAAQNIPGVKHVRDHLVWVEPNSGMTIGPA